MALLIVGNLMSVNYTISGDGGTIMTFNDGVTEITQADVHTYIQYEDIMTLVIPTSVVTICGTYADIFGNTDGAFFYMYRLTTVTINTPSSLQVIGNGAFYYCLSLTFINLPSGLQSIGSYSFENSPYYFYSSIGSLIIPPSTKLIGDYAFNAASILNITYTSTTTLGSNPFPEGATITMLPGPDPPTNLSGTLNPSSIDLLWTAPTQTGATPIAYYLITDTTSSTVYQTPDSNPSYTITGIDPEVDYTYTLQTVNQDDATSAPSTPITIGPSNPNPPTDLSGTWNPSSIDLLWTAPTQIGSAPIAYYLITDTSSGTVYQTPDSNTNYTITGTDPRITYTYTLQTVNQNDASSVQSIPITVEPSKPDPPTDLSGIWNPSSIDLLWTAPTETGSFPIAYYLITDTDNTTVYQTPDNNTNYTITGTEPNTIYNYTIQTVNQNDISSVSSASLRVEPPLNPPRDISIIPTYNTLTLNWTAPIETGSHPITNYIIINTSTLVSVTVPYTTTSYTFTGLTDDILYTYVLRTVTDFGISADSDNVSGRLIPLPPELLDCSPALALNAISKGGNFASAITTALGKQMNNTTIAAKVFAQTQATVCCSTSPSISPFSGGTTCGAQTLALIQNQTLCTYNQNLAVAKLRQIPGCPINNSQRFAKYQRFPSAEANCMPPVIITGLPKALNGPCTNVIGISQTWPPS